MRGVASSLPTPFPALRSGAGSAVGSPATGPASISSRRRRSATIVANGPSVERSIQSGIGRRPITPLVGLMPTSPQNAAGILIEPPPSVAVAIGTNPPATAAAEPPLEPPGDQSVAHGFLVVPNRRFDVKPSQANSGRFDLPTTMAPASRRRDGTSPSDVAGGASANSSDPCVVRMPATSSRSLTSTGTPNTGPGS